jgi:hypothetical protein
MGLIKKAEENSFSIIGNWGVLIYTSGEDQDDDYNYVDEESEISPDNLDDELLDTAINFANDDFDAETKAIIMKQMQEKCKENETVTDIVFDLDSHHSYMHVYGNKPFSDETKAEILDIVNGQYSDGWGEGLEQRSFADEQSEDYGRGVHDEYFVQLWPDDVNLRLG